MASSLTKAHAWRAARGDAMIAWVDFHHVDAAGDPQTFRWGAVPVAGPSFWLEPRLMTFGPCERALSDEGRLEGSTFTFTLADTDNLIRGWFADAQQSAVRGVEIVVQVQRLDDFRAGETPFVFFRGVVKDYQALPGREMRFDCEDWLSHRLEQPVATPQIGDAFPSAPAETRERYGPVWYGAVTDAGETPEIGAVPCVYVGQLPDLAATPWHAFAVAAHACKAIDDLYVTKPNPAVAAWAFHNTTGNYADGEIVRVGSRDYTFQTVLTNVSGHVLIGVDEDASLANLEAAITGGAGSGTVYAAATTENGVVTASIQGASSLRVTALTAGTAGNAIECSTTAANATWIVEGGAQSGVLQNGTDTVLQTDKVLVYGGSVAAPGKTDFATLFGDVYHDAADGSRWTLVYLSLAEGQAIVDAVTGVEGADAGSELRANIQGVETVGDGTGTLLAEPFAQWGHFLDNYVLPDDPYAGGAWGATPAWADTTPRRDTTSFTDAAADAALLIPSLTTAAWGVPSRVVQAHGAGGRFTTDTTGSRERLTEVCAKLAVSTDAAFGFTRAGQFRVVVEPPVVDDTPVDAFTEALDIAAGSFAWDDDTGPAVRYDSQDWAARPVWDGDGGVAYALEGAVAGASPFPVPVSASPGVLSFDALRSGTPAVAVVTRRLERAATPRRTATFRTGVTAALRELGEIVSLAHSEGAGPDGWGLTPGYDPMPGMIRRIAVSLDLNAVDLACTVSLAVRTLIPVELEEVLAIYNLGGHRHITALNEGGTDVPYDWRTVTIDWSAAPGGYDLVARVSCKVALGTMTPRIVNASGGATIATGTAVTATAFAEQEIIIPAGVGSIGYNLRPVSIGGGATVEDVWLFGSVYWKPS